MENGRCGLPNELAEGVTSLQVGSVFYRRQLARPQPFLPLQGRARAGPPKNCDKPNIRLKSPTLALQRLSGVGRCGNGRWRASY